MLILYISQIPVPGYFQRDILDIRKAVTTLVACQQQVGSRIERDLGLAIDRWIVQSKPMVSTSAAAPRSNHGKRQFLNVHAQLHALNLSPFQGRQHCGIDVSYLSFDSALHVISSGILLLRSDGPIFLHLTKFIGQS